MHSSSCSLGSMHLRMSGNCGLQEQTINRTCSMPCQLTELRRSSSCGWRGTKVDPIECCRFQEEGNLWTNFSCSTRRTCITQKVIMYVWAESSPSYRSSIPFVVVRVRTSWKTLSPQLVWFPLLGTEERMGNLNRNILSDESLNHNTIGKRILRTEAMALVSAVAPSLQADHSSTSIHLHSSPHYT